MGVEEFSLKLTKLSKYASYIVVDPKDEMSRFMMGVSRLVTKECSFSMIHDMVYAK